MEPLLTQQNKLRTDEKWFFLTKVKWSYYNLLDEEVTERFCKNKCFIIKIMLMAAVTKLRHDFAKKQYLNDKNVR